VSVTLLPPDKAMFMEYCAVSTHGGGADGATKIA
jgi:hypothetical protein